MPIKYGNPKKFATWISEQYQRSPWFHPLTCPCGAELYAEHSDTDVWLTCPEHQELDLYRQTPPEHLVELYHRFPAQVFIDKFPPIDTP